jgi:hypothetical protein
MIIRFLISDNIVVAKETFEKQEDFLKYIYEGVYDTVIDDPDEIYKIGDTYDVESYVIHYIGEPETTQKTRDDD